jgi:hypothetical protein
MVSRNKHDTLIRAREQAQPEAAAAQQSDR